MTTAGIWHLGGEKGTDTHSSMVKNPVGSAQRATKNNLR